MIRFGVQGAGWFASRRHLPELVSNPEVELVALCRRSPEPLAKLAAHFGVERTYTDLASMLAAERLDAVLVCTPHHLHHADAAACLEAGCHLLLEKPMALTAADAEDLVARAERSGRLLEVAYNPPYWSHCRWLRERVAAGDLGDLELVDLRWTGNMLAVLGREALPENLPGVVPPTMFRGDAAQMGGGVLVDSGSHQVCESMWVTGQDWRGVSAVMDSVPDDVRYSLQFELAGGGLGSIASIGDSARPGRQTISVYSGTKATCTLTGAPFVARWTTPDGAETVYHEADFRPVPQPVNAFVDALLGRAEPRSPGRDCVRYVRAIEAAYQSAATGRRVALG